ncbi:hypothetical protein [Kineosporia sp. A_224]|uniref:hypothetical protein n=1 Tax=Kineosporia sp. A_224 TaxID=1962180 RepID=UPI00117B4088|nr:hypothetical protein [Kineosporia sp. A_224]
MFLLFSLPLASIAVALFHANGATLQATAVLLAVLLLGWWADLRSHVIDQSLYYAGYQVRVQTLDALLSGTRMAATLVAMIVTKGNLNVALLLAAAAALGRVPFIDRWSNSEFPDRHEPVLAERKFVREMTLRQLPVEAIYVLQPQMILLLLTLKLGTTEIAQFGALSRLTQVMLPVNAVLTAYLIPRFARQNRRLVSTFFGLLGIVALPGIILVAISVLAPNWLLWLLGRNYQNLHTEVMWAAAVTLLATVSGAAWHLLANRGFTRYASIQIPMNLAWCGFAFFFWPIDNLQEVFLFQGGFSVTLMTSVALEARAALTPREGAQVK